MDSRALQACEPRVDASVRACSSRKAITQAWAVRDGVGRRVASEADYCRTASSVQSYEAIGARRSRLIWAFRFAPRHGSCLAAAPEHQHEGTEGRASRSDGQGA